MFEDADWALLIGAQPRGPGMERSQLLDINGQLFEAQGRALNEAASRDCKMLVVGNPCNTNALIGMANAPDLPRRNWHALTRLDENRAKCQLALKAGKFYTSVTNMCVWGNHSTTQVPDFVNAKIGGVRAGNVIQDAAWLKEQFTPTVANRGGALIKKWGRSSAASTAVSIADHLRSLYTPTPVGDCFSSAVWTGSNPYGIDPGLIFSMPCRSNGDGDYEVRAGRAACVRMFVWGERVAWRPAATGHVACRAQPPPPHLTCPHGRSSPTLSSTTGCAPSSRCGGGPGQRVRLGAATSGRADRAGRGAPPAVVLPLSLPRHSTYTLPACLPPSPTADLLPCAGVGGGAAEGARLCGAPHPGRRARCVPDHRGHHAAG